MKAQDGWQEAAGQAWVLLQEKTDAYLEALGTAAIDRLAPKPGERILDVGCGTGQTTIQLAHSVGPSGRVVAIDIAEPMLMAARRRAERAGLTQVEFVLGDAANKDVGQNFDAIYSRFGVMFFDDSVLAFSRLRSALRPGGRLAFVCWQALEVNDWSNVAVKATRSVAPDQPLPPLLEPGKPGPFYFADPSFIRELLTGAGFTQVEVEAHYREIQFGAAQTVADAVEYSLQIGPAARFMASADPSLLPEFKRALTAAFTPYQKPEGIMMGANTWIIRAVAD